MTETSPPAAETPQGTGTAELAEINWQGYAASIRRGNPYAILPATLADHTDPRARKGFEAGALAVAAHVDSVRGEVLAEVLAQLEDPGVTRPAPGQIAHWRQRARLAASPAAQAGDQ